MSYNTKNRTEQGGGKTVIGGELEILSGATIKADEGATVEGFGGTPLLPAIDFNDVTYESGTGFVYNGAALEEGLYDNLPMWFDQTYVENVLDPFAERADVRKLK